MTECRVSHEGVVGRDRVPVAGNVQPEQLAEQGIGPLTVLGVTAAAVPRARVEHPVGPEEDHPAVVVGGRVLDGQQDRAAAGIDRCALGWPAEPRDGHGPVRIGVVDEEAAALGVVGSEGH